MMTKLGVPFFCLALILSAGCGDDSGAKPDASTQKEAGPDGPQPDSTQPDGPQPDGTTTAPTFAQIYSQVIQPNCSCHIGASHSTGLTMADATSAYANLVDKATGGSACLGNTRVKTGDSASSALYHKLTGDGQVCGARMPFGGSQLAQPLIDLVKAWIDGGAKKQ